jgi:hypothetical protein
MAAVEQLPREENGVNAVDSDSLLVHQCLGHAGSRRGRRRKLHCVLIVTDGLVVAFRSVCGQRAPDPVDCLERLHGVVRRHAVVQKEGDLGIGGVTPQVSNQQGYGDHLFKNP